MIRGYFVSNSYSNITINKIIIYAILLNLLILIMNVFQMVENHKHSNYNENSFSNAFYLEQQQNEILNSKSIDSLRTIAMKYLEISKKISQRQNAASGDNIFLDISSLFQLCTMVLLVSLFILRRRLITNNS
jgi:hypothetical protein